MAKTLPTMTAYARVTGLRRGTFVEFEFSINDEDLSLELIMPLAAFHEFCHRHEAVVLDVGGVLARGTDPSTAPAAQGADAPGLYRQPHQHPQSH